MCEMDDLVMHDDIFEKPEIKEGGVCTKGQLFAWNIGKSVLSAANIKMGLM